MFNSNYTQYQVNNWCSSDQRTCLDDNNYIHCESLDSCMPANLGPFVSQCPQQCLQLSERLNGEG